VTGESVLNDTKDSRVFVSETPRVKVSRVSAQFVGDGASGSGDWSPPANGPRVQTTE